MEPIVYRVKEFCQKYALSRTTFYREVSSQRLHIIKRGCTTLITHEEANRWFTSLCQSQSH